MSGRTQIIIEDHVVPQLLTSAIEAYEFEHRTHAKGRAKFQLETYGLLWGYSLPERESVPSRLVAVVATVETSALRHEDWVNPNENSLIMKRNFFREYWPQLELIGTFHSHPYDSLNDVNSEKGWRATGEKGDKTHWQWFHENVCPDMKTLAHLVVTITELERSGTAWPDRLPGGESATGYVLTAGKRKLWIKGYCTDTVEPEDQNSSSRYSVQEDILLMIPTVQQLFQPMSLRT